MTKYKQKVAIISLVLAFLVSLVGLFLVGNVKSFTASADEITNQNFPNTVDWEISSEWENGDNIFGKYFRFYYKKSFKDSLGVENTKSFIYIGSNNVVEIRKVSNESISLGVLVMLATNANSAEKEVITLPSRWIENNINGEDESFFDFYIPEKLKEEYLFEKDLTFYEAHEEKIVSERMVALVNPQDSLNDGDSENRDETQGPGSNVSNEKRNGDVAAGLFTGGALLIVGYFIIKNLSTKKRRR